MYESMEVCNLCSWPTDEGTISRIGEWWGFISNLYCELQTCVST